MKVKFFDQNFDVENNEEAIKNIFIEINQLLVKQNLHFSHIRIDGDEIFDDHFNYVISRINDLNSIEIVVKPYKDLANEMLFSANEYLTRILPNIDVLTESFYQNPTKNHWLEFEQLLEGIQWLLQFTSVIIERKVDYYNAQRYHQIQGQFINELNNLEQAMTDGDTILISDLLSYEIIPILVELQDEILNTMEDEELKQNNH